jgi:hypothetical protein
MKKLVLFICLGFSVQLMTAKNPFKKTPTVPGTYGVNACADENTNNKEEIIQLKLNEDQSFELIDNTDPNKKIATTGTWTLDGNNILLSNYSSTYAISTKWKIDPNYPCIKSRLGLEFTRICKK